MVEVSERGSWKRRLQFPRLVHMQDHQWNSDRRGIGREQNVGLPVGDNVKRSALEQKKHSLVLCLVEKFLLLACETQW